MHSLGPDSHRVLLKREENEGWKRGQQLQEMKSELSELMFEIKEMIQEEPRELDLIERIPCLTQSGLSAQSSSSRA